MATNTKPLERPVIILDPPPYEAEINLCFQLAAFLRYVRPFVPPTLADSWLNASEDVEDLLARLEDMKQKAA